MKVIDSFMFFNEFDMLKLRLNYLNDVVDHFIISESNYTHSGKSKPYYLDEVWNDIPATIRNKIIRVKYEPNINQFNIPTNVTECDLENGNWKLEREQRNLITQQLSQFSQNDLFMISDVDEIPRKEVVKNFTGARFDEDFCYVARCEMFYFNFTTFSHANCPGTVFTSVQNALNKGCDYLRGNRFEIFPVEFGGWHFTYLGSVEQIKNKLESFAHQEYNKEQYTNEENILRAIKTKTDLFQREHEKTFQEYDFYRFPEDLRDFIIQIYPQEFYITETDSKPSRQRKAYIDPSNPANKYVDPKHMPPLLEASLNPDGNGGTEIMGRAWQDYVLPAAPDLADWHWCVIPGDNIISPDSSNIVWLHPHHREPNMEQLMDPQFQKLFKAYIFVSDWQYERFIETFKLPAEKCYVLKNAIKPFEPHKKPEGKLQLIFHPNPIRGLDVLLEAIKLLPDEDFDLHVYHELDPDARKTQYLEGLQTYEYSHVCPQEEAFLRYCLSLAVADKRVVRHTRSNNSKIREQLKNTHIFAYPAYFEETSCICMIEALAAGCSVLSSNLAALPETGLGYARHYGYIPDRNKHIVRFAEELKKTLDEYRAGKFDATDQVKKVNEYYSWETRVKDWVELDKQLWKKS
jgi:glycosyltransferase involved in cell wall biosynthesis